MVQKIMSKDNKPNENHIVGNAKGYDPLKAKDMRQKIVDRRGENVYYDSSKAPRSVLGHIHYCTSCPGWNKATNMRFLYSRWEETEVCGCKLPWGRKLDTFDSDIVVDIAAHQSCFQICRGEGDIMLWRLEGGDLSDNEEVHAMTDIPNVFEVFSALTLELSKINLKDAAALGLGTRMGATVWNYDARSKSDGPGERVNDPEGESMFYDSVTAKRTCLGKLCHHDVCMPPVYKITSERIMYAEWDMWYPCDEPSKLICLPVYILTAFFRDLCCGFGSGRAEKAKDVIARRKENKAKDKDRSWLNSCCACPIGRTANFMDIDIIGDVGAHQKCSELCLNEGDLQLHVLGGGDGADASGDADENGIFTVRFVPEVFAKFDDLSYELSQMNLTHFRQNVMSQEMRR